MQQQTGSVPLPDALVGKSQRASLAHDILWAAQSGYHYTFREWAYIRQDISPGGISSTISDLRYEWNWDIPKDEWGGPYVVRSVGGVPPTEFEPVEPVPWTHVEVPADWRTKKSPAIGKGNPRPRPKQNQGPSLPPLGVDLQVTEAKVINSDQVTVTVDGRWRGTVKAGLVIVGSTLQVMGAGLGQDGVWLETTEFTINNVK